MFLRAAAGGTSIPLRLFLVPLLLPAPSHNWHHPDHLSVLARPTSDAPPEVQTGLAPGQVPVDGKLGGLLGAYFRYYNVYMRGPTEDDEAEAIRLADHARCDVCTTLVKNMLQRNFTREEELMPSGTGTGSAASTETDSATLAPIEFDQRAFSQIAIKEKISEDALLDWFEGHRDHGTDNLRYDAAVAAAGVDPNTTDTKDVVRQQMLDKKVGCMKLFKDDFLYLGYSIRPCPEEERKKTPCVFPPGSNKLSELPSDHSVNTYELWKEMVFFSCEQTIGKYQSEMAEWLVASILEKGGKRKQKEQDKGANKKQKSLNIEQLAEGACKTAAKCGRQLAQSRKPLEGGIGSEKPSMKSVNAGGNGASYGSGAAGTSATGTKKKKSVGKKKNERKKNGKNAAEKAKSTSSGKTKKKSAKEKGNEKDEL